MAYKKYERSPAYKPGQKILYKLSRSKIELFIQCPRCFWLNERLKIKRPSGPPFQINKAIDELFKKEFDVYRVKQQPHPMMVENNIDAVPFSHQDLDKWRNNFTGVSFLHEPTNLYIFGAIDDVWVDIGGRLMVVDYKATSKNSEINLDSDWQISYKRQMEIYQWLLKQNGFEVNNRGYFVYTNARMDVDGFFDKLEFITKVIPYDGDSAWIEKTLVDMKECLENEMPKIGTAAMGGPCEFCTYAKERTELTVNHLNNIGK
ncbi:MAG TPA: PD-(D/E)XK nuclease family protein [Candidatus Saccharimonadia bacterium]|nr:PD-(D/E)XK nuclease family protein [Candidatus Saccharimonadia bacterium]